MGNRVILRSLVMALYKIPQLHQTSNIILVRNSMKMLYPKWLGGLFSGAWGCCFFVWEAEGIGAVWGRCVDG